MKKILALDDDKEVLFLLNRFLTAMGYLVRYSNNGEDGIKLLKNSNDIDLVITDIGMPKMDGNDVARYIKNGTRNNIPIIAITGSEESFIERKLFDHVLIKPFGMETLLDIIRLYV